MAVDRSWYGGILGGIAPGRDLAIYLLFPSDFLLRPPPLCSRFGVLVLTEASPVFYALYISLCTYILIDLCSLTLFNYSNTLRLPAIIDIVIL